MTQKILVIGNYLIGDSLQTIYAFSALKQQFPDAQFHVIAPAYSKGVFDLIDRSYIWEKELSEAFFPFYFSGENAWSTIKQAWYRRHEFDDIVIFPGGFGAALYAWLLGGKRRVGSNTDSRGFLLTHKIPSNDGQFTTTQYFNEVSALLGCKTEVSISTFLGDQLAVELPMRYVVIAPMSSIQSRIWSFDRYDQLLRTIIVDYDVVPVFVGSDKEHDLLDSLSQKVGGINLSGRLSIPQVYTLVKGAEFYLGAYSGIIYVTALTEVPAFAITGPSDPYGTLPSTGRVYPIFKEKKDEQGNVVIDGKARNDVNINEVQIEDVMAMIKLHY
jgi:heptosyltransferase-2